MISAPVYDLKSVWFLYPRFHCSPLVGVLVASFFVGHLPCGNFRTLFPLFSDDYMYANFIYLHTTEELILWPPHLQNIGGLSFDLRAARAFQKVYPLDALLHNLVIWRAWGRLYQQILSGKAIFVYSSHTSNIYPISHNHSSRSRVRTWINLPDMRVKK